MNNKIANETEVHIAKNMIEAIQNESEIVRAASEVIRLSASYNEIKEKYKIAINDFKNALRLNEKKTISECASDIIEAIRVNKSKVYSRTKAGNTTQIRQFICYILKRQYSFTLEAIGKELGRDHSSIIYAIKSIEDDLFTKNKFTMSLFERYERAKEK